MNRESLLKKLSEIFELIAAHPRAWEELIKIIVGTGYELKVISLLAIRIQTLFDLGVNAIHLKEFEPIGNGLFSLHISGKDFNIRILYSFLPDQSPALLLSFYEKAGKSYTDYSSKIEPAKRRLNELLGGTQKNE